MAEDIKKVISIDTKGAESVKDLIDKVEKLRGILKTLDQTSDEYKKTLGELKTAQDSLSSSLGENKTQAEAAEGSYNALAQQMKVLKKEWKATADEAERNALGKEIKGINDQLKALDQSIGNNQRNVGNYAGSFQSLKEEIRQARDIMAGAARGSDEYAEAAKRAAEASDKLRDMQKEIVNGASGLDNQFSVMTNILGGVSGGFAAVQGAMALFGAESENLQKTFVKLQAAMSMTQGFKALAELPKALNAAKIAFGGVTTGVKAFTKSLTGVKGAIAATGIGLLLVLLGELIAHWDEVTAAVSNFVGGLDHLKEVMAGVGNSIGQFIAGPIKALDLALHKDFKGAWEAFKNGWKFAENYAVGVQKQMVKNVQNDERKKREEFDKTKDDYIKDMEAQKGADWKYTKEGEKTYREYYANRLKMFKEGSEEYKKAQRELWAYDRDLLARRNGSGGGGGKSEEQKLAEEHIKAINEEYDRLAERRKTERQKVQEDYEERLVLLKNGLDDGLRSIEEYNTAVEELTKERNEKIAEIEKEEREELYKNALDALKVLQTKNQKEYELIRADIAREIFPGTKEVELQAKKFNSEGGIARFITGPMSEKQWEKLDLGKLVVWDSSDFETIDVYLKNLAYDIDNLREYAAAGENNNNPGVGFFKNLVIYSQMASDAVDKLSEKRRELNAALLSDAGEETIKQLTAELDEARQEYNDLIEDIKENAFRELGVVDNLAETTIGNARGWLSTFFDWRIEKGENIVKKEIENNNFELLSFIAASEKRIEQIQKELDTENLADEEKLKLLQEVEELKRQEIEKTAEVEQKNADLTLETIRRVEDGKKALIQSTLDAIANTGNILMNWSDNIVRRETKNGNTISKEKERQAKTMFNVGKALAISEAVISTYQGAQESYTSLASIPYVGPALGIAAAAAAVTAGILRVQQISSQEFSQNSSISDAGSSVGITSAVAVPQLETNPYQYTSNITNAQDENELNKPIIVQISDVEDALKVRENRTVETSF